VISHADVLDIPTVLVIPIVLAISIGLVISTGGRNLPGRRLSSGQQNRNDNN